MTTRTTALQLIVLVTVAACGTRPDPNFCVGVANLCTAGSTCDQLLGICVPVDGGSPFDGSSASTDTAVDATFVPEAESDIVDAAVIAPVPDTRAPDPVTVTFRSPAAGTYTNANLTVAVEVSGSPDAVDLFDGDNLIATLHESGSAPWDTKSVPEGTHQLTARARRAGQETVTGPVTVIVDRTPPTVTSKLPFPNDSGVSLYDPIDITFSEPVASAAIDATRVSLLDDSGVLAIGASLDADGTTVHTKLTNPRSLQLPSTVTVSIRGFSDRAGNPMQPISWSWTYPVWLDLGSAGKGGRPSLKIGADGHPVVVAAIPAIDETWVPSVAKHHSRAEWTPIGLPPGAVSGSQYTALALNPNGDPVVAWAEQNPTVGARTIRTAGFSLANNHWGAAAAELDAIPGHSGADNPSIAIDPSGRALLAWQERVSADFGAATGIFVATRSAGKTTWDFGAAPVSTATEPNLLLDAHASPVILTTSSSQHVVVRLEDRGWLSYPTAQFPQSMAVDSNGVPVVAWVDNNVLYLKYLVAGVWQPYVAALPVPDFFFDAHLVLTSDNHPIVVFLTTGATSERKLAVVRWTGSAWNTELRIDAANGASPAIALDSHDRPAIAWSEQPGPIDKQRILVVQSNQ